MNTAERINAVIGSLLSLVMAALGALTLGGWLNLSERLFEGLVLLALGGAVGLLCAEQGRRVGD